MPEFPIPESFRADTHKEGANRLLRDLVVRGAHERYGEQLSDEVTARLENELGVVADMGFSDYFLVVWDLIRHAREQGIRVGPGRGSSAGCCIAYCLRIVDIDPLRYGLIFERFLNPGRRSMPDIDMDFDERYRGDMIRYAAERYGSDHVAQIVTFSTIKARAAVRDAARVLGYPPQLGDKIAKAMPPLVMGQDLPLEACFTPTPGYEGRYVEAAELRSLYDSDAEVKHSIDVAMGFVDKRRQDGIHAAAVVITKEPILDYVPVQRKSGPYGSGEDAPIVTQYEATAIEKLGLLKMDFLGLRNLAIIERTLENIRRRHGIEVDIDHVALDDPKVYEMLRLGNSIGIFQLEGDKMRQLMRRLAPTGFDDIAALNALYRPGPLSRERAQRLRRPQERSPAGQLRPPRPRGDPRRDLGAHDLPRGHHARRHAHRRLLDDRGRRPAQGLLEEDPRDDSRPALEVRRRRRTRRLRSRTRRDDLQQDRAVRRLRLPEEPRLRLRAARLPERVAEGELPGRVHGGAA